MHVRGEAPGGLPFGDSGRTVKLASVASRWSLLRVPGEVGATGVAGRPASALKEAPICCCKAGALRTRPRASPRRG